MLRRDVETILAAHRLDPLRRELYVEGRKDLLFLKLVADVTASGKGQIWEIETVDVPGVAEGGNRERVITLANRVADSPVSIRGFVDADNDWIIPRELPGNIWRSDGRDLESYLLRPDCFAKLGVTIGLASSDSAGLLAGVIGIGRQLTALRILSARSGLALPFQRTEPGRAIRASRDEMRIDMQRYVTSLLNNAGRSLRELEGLCAAVEGVRSEIAGMPDMAVVGGKDAMVILDAVLKRMRRPVDSRVLFGTFERGMVADYPVLTDVVGYLQD